MEDLGTEVNDEERCNWVALELHGYGGLEKVGELTCGAQPVVQHFTAKVAGQPPQPMLRCASHKLSDEFVDKLVQGLRQ